jgi:hypothetical protein
MSSKKQPTPSPIEPPLFSPVPPVEKMNTNVFLARDAISVPLSIPEGATSPPTDIQWMPPGEHTITAFKGDEPVTLTVRVHAGTAARLNALLQDLRSKAAAGIEDYPYFDFNHDDGEASGRPREFYWAGDDLKTGGVRAQVDWSERGQQSLVGKVPSFRRFSPSFSVDAAGEVTGAPINMGGLVNRAAFKLMQPIVAGQPATSHQQPTRKANMDAEKLAADLAAAQTKISELTNQLAKAQSEEVVKAKDAEITTLKGQITELQGKLATGAKESAKAIVDAAVKAGKLAPQNTALHEKWINAIAADPTLAETLNAMAPNPALATVIGSGSAGAAAGAGAAGGTPAEQFATEVKAKAAELKDKSKALDAVINAKPELYRAWREANGKPQLV